MKLKVGYITYSVLRYKPTDADGDAALGLIDPSLRKIWIDMRQTPEDQAETLIHEALHALWDYRDLAAKVDEETAVTHLATGLATLLADNPGFGPLIAQTLAGTPLPL